MNGGKSYAQADCEYHGFTTLERVDSKGNFIPIWKSASAHYDG